MNSSGTLAAPLCTPDELPNYQLARGLFEEAVDRQLADGVTSDPHLRGMDKGDTMSYIDQFLEYQVCEGMQYNYRWYGLSAKVPELFKLWSENTAVVVMKE